jgi:phosphoesterase RecJ-like protein
VAALVREQLKDGREGVQKVSLRASADAVDVSVIARQQGGGGHRQAAGFSTTLDRSELVEFLRAEIAAQQQ